MKKIKLVLLSIFLLFGMSIFAVSVSAEENSEETVEVETDTSQEEPTGEEEIVVTTGEKFEDFIQKWFPQMLSVLFGTGGAGTVILLFLKLVLRKQNKKIEELDKQDKLARNDLYSAKEAYVEATLKLNTSMKQIEELSIIVKKTNEEQGKPINIQTKQIELMLESVSELKSLVCSLAVSNRELTADGRATEIISACDEKNLNAIKQEALEYIEKEGE